MDGALGLVNPGRNPLEIFSAEVWQMVLEQLKDPKDLCNASHANTLFRGLLQSKNESWNSMLFSLVIPQLHNYLSGKDLLNLRGVNKDLKNSVDNHLEAGQGQVKIFLNLRYYMMTIRLSQMIWEIGNQPKIKLVGGVVHAAYSEIYRPNFRRFFGNLGHKVIHLKLFPDHHIQHLALSPLRMLEVLQFVLKRTPNLKTLELNHSITCAERGVPYLTWRNRIFQKLGEVPLPSLANLTGFTVVNDDHVVRGPREGWDGVIYAILEAYQGQLQKLELAEISNLPYLSMDKLKEVKISGSKLDLLGTLGRVTAPLEKVAIDNNGMEFEMEKLFLCLNPFKGTLKELSLSTSDYIGLATDQNIQFLALEKLKLWSLFGCQVTNLEFLLNFPRLRELDIQAKFCRRGLQKRLTVDGNQGANTGLMLSEYLKEDGTLDQVRFKECPVWKLLPRLERVKIEQ